MLGFVGGGGGGSGDGVVVVGVCGLLGFYVGFVGLCCLGVRLCKICVDFGIKIQLGMCGCDG